MTSPRWNTLARLVGCLAVFVLLAALIAALASLMPDVPRVRR